MTWAIEDGSVVAQQATVPGGTPAAGYHTVWVRSSDGHVIRTDSGGTDHDLEAAGGGSLAGIPGVIYGRGSTSVNELYADVGDRNSYPGTGSTLTDLTGSRSGSIDAAVTISNGHLLWSGATGAVTYTTDSAIENIFDGGGTIIAWIRADAYGELNLGRIAGTESTGTTYGWYAQLGSPVSNTYRIYFGQSFDGGNGQWYTTSTCALHEWVCVAITYSNSSTGNDPTFYLNGIADTTIELSTPGGTRRSDSGNDLYIGNRAADDRTFNGAIDFVQLYDVILSAEEIRQIFRVTQDRLRPSLIGPDAWDASAHAQDIWVRGGTGGSTTGQGANVYVVSGATIGSGQAGTLYLMGGASTNAGHGGDIYMTAGDQSNASIRAGDIYITGGSKLTSHSGDAGDIVLTGGDKSGSASGTVGGIRILTGTGGTNASGAELRIEVQALNSGQTVGNLVLQAGSNTGSGHPGDLFLYGSDSTGQNAGEIRLVGGDATGFGDFGGHIYLTTGASTNYYTGYIYLQTAAQTSGTRSSGSITITVGDTFGNFTGAPAGTLTLQGSNHTGTTGDAAAGSIIANAGDCASNVNATYGKAGDFIAAAGDQTGTGTALPGDIKLSAGSKTAGNATGGHVYLYAGNGYGTGAGGNIYALTGQKGTGQDGWFEVRNRASADDKGWRVTEFDKYQTTTNSPVTVLTVGSLTVNGTNLAVDVYVTGMGDTSTTEVASARKIQTFYRDAGTVTAITAHLDNNQFVGSGSAMTVSLTISGNNVLLQVTGQSGVTVNWSGIVKVKKGGI